MDNYYTSPELFEELYFKETYACSTVRINRKSIYIYKIYLHPHTQNTTQCNYTIDIVHVYISIRLSCSCYSMSMMNLLQVYSNSYY